MFQAQVRQAALVDILYSPEGNRAAGHVVYGSSTVLVYSTGNGVHGFTLDPAIGSFILTHENVRMPEQAATTRSTRAYGDRFPDREMEKYLLPAAEAVVEPMKKLTEGKH